MDDQYKNFKALLNAIYTAYGVGTKDQGERYFDDIFEKLHSEDKETKLTGLSKLNEFLQEYAFPKTDISDQLGLLRYPFNLVDFLFGTSWSKVRLPIRDHDINEEISKQIKKYLELSEEVGLSEDELNLLKTKIFDFLDSVYAEYKSFLGLDNKDVAELKLSKNGGLNIEEVQSKLFPESDTIREYHFVLLGTNGAFEDITDDIMFEILGNEFLKEKEKIFFHIACKTGVNRVATQISSELPSEEKCQPEDLQGENVVMFDVLKEHLKKNGYLADKSFLEEHCKVYAETGDVGTEPTLRKFFKEFEKTNRKKALIVISCLNTRVRQVIDFYKIEAEFNKGKEQTFRDKNHIERVRFLIFSCQAFQKLLQSKIDEITILRESGYKLKEDQEQFELKTKHWLPALKKFLELPNAVIPFFNSEIAKGVYGFCKWLEYQPNKLEANAEELDGQYQPPSIGTPPCGSAAQKSADKPKPESEIAQRRTTATTATAVANRGDGCILM